LPAPRNPVSSVSGIGAGLAVGPVIAKLSGQRQRTPLLF